MFYWKNAKNYAISELSENSRKNVFVQKPHSLNYFKLLRQHLWFLINGNSFHPSIETHPSNKLVIMVFKGSPFSKMFQKNFKKFQKFFSKFNFGFPSVECQLLIVRKIS